MLLPKSFSFIKLIKLESMHRSDLLYFEVNSLEINMQKKKKKKNMPRNKTHFDDQQSDLVYGLCDQTTRLEFQVPAPTLTPMTLGEFTSLGLCFLTRQMCCSK